MRRSRNSGGPVDRLEDWLDEYYAEVYRTARMILLSPDAAEEAAREAFVRAWRYRAAAPAGAGVRPWLLRAVVHSCSRRSQPDPAEHPPIGVDPVLAALLMLPADGRTVVVLRFWSGLTTVEAAGVLGERPERVTARLEAALAHLAGGPLAAATREARP